MTQRQDYVRTLFTGILYMPFSKFHISMGLELGRPVLVHEMVEENLLKELKRKAYNEWQEIKKIQNEKLLLLSK